MCPKQGITPGCSDDSTTSYQLIRCSDKQISSQTDSIRECVLAVNLPDTCSL